MSVRVTAILGHPWEHFARENLQKIASAISGAANDLKFCPMPPSKTPEEDFATYGSTLCSVTNSFTWRFGSKVIILSSCDRWSRFLINSECRQLFLNTCKRICVLSKSSEVLILPGGSVIEDLIYDNAVFETFKDAASQHWGPANININRIYEENELYRNNGKRVDYALVHTNGLFEGERTVTNY